SDTHHGAASEAPGALARSTTRTRSAGGFAMNSSISQTSVSDRVAPWANRACPTVAPTTRGDHEPAANAESSKRKPSGLSPSALRAGTRRWAGRRGRHSGSVRTRSSPSVAPAGAATTTRGRLSGPLAGSVGRGGQVRWCLLHPHLLDLRGPTTARDPRSRHRNPSLLPR